MSAKSQQRYWLFKSEPSTFSITDLANAPKQSTLWDGVRNYQARNFMRDDMQVGDLGFFYHSSCKTPGIMGIVTITQTQQTDITALDPKSPYFDPKATADNPRWITVVVTLKQQFKEPISLETLKAQPKLADMPLLKRGNRLSILPISNQQWHLMLTLAK